VDFVETLHAARESFDKKTPRNDFFSHLAVFSVSFLKLFIFSEGNPESLNLSPVPCCAVP